MGAIFGGAPTPPPIYMPPPPPMPEMPADPPKQADESVKKARSDATARARASAGMASTDVTKGGLVDDEAKTTGKKALGA